MSSASAPMSSSSLFSPVYELRYDIILNSRDDDTGSTFTDLLNTALEEAGYCPFRDDHKIEIEEVLMHSRMKNIIQLSKYSIIIISKGYACSRRCLDELVMILECKRTSKHRVLPVYCDVDASDVERQLGRTLVEYEEQFKDEIDDGRRKEWRDKVKVWSEALQEAVNLPGFTLRNAVDGTRIISLIIDLLGGSGQTASSQSFPFCHGCSYHICLSFKDEEDMDKGFTDQLFVALMKAGFHTFRDDQKIEREEPNKYSRPKQIIQQSNCSIIIFSKGYASSKWRLDELVMILDCYRTCQHRIVPIFYDLERSDVRNQLGSVGEAFAVYEKEIKDEIDDALKGQLRDDVRRWREAFREVAKLAGFNLRNVANGCESELIKKIVGVMEDKVSRAVLKGPPPLVGLHSRAKTINFWVQDT